MCLNIIKSYCAYMFKVLKKFLLFFLVFQLVMMPVSQAFAARHIHDTSRAKTITSVAPSSVMITKFQRFVKSSGKDGLSDMAHLFSQPHKTHLQSSRCGKRNGHKGDCDSCQCTSIVAAPVSMQVTPVFISAESYNVKLGCPLYNVIIAPPLRPPTS